MTNVYKSLAASVVQRHQAVVTAFSLCTEAGLPDILHACGNTIGAAAAASRLRASGLSDQTPLLVRSADREQRRGHRACKVPSTPATLDGVWRNHGLMHYITVMRPGTGVVGGGRPVARYHHQQTQGVINCVRSQAMDRSVTEHLRDVSHPEFAATLRQRALIRIEDFYPGRIVNLVSADLRWVRLHHRPRSDKSRSVRASWRSFDDLATIDVRLSPLDGGVLIGSRGNSRMIRLE